MFVLIQNNQEKQKKKLGKTGCCTDKSIYRLNFNFLKDKI